MVNARYCILFINTIADYVCRSIIIYCINTVIKSVTNAHDMVSIVYPIV